MLQQNALSRIFVILLLLQLGMWTAIPALVHQAPPLDVVEMMVVGGDGQVANYKHPNLPGLLLGAVNEIAGGSVWTPFVLSQLSILICFAVVYRLGREELTPTHALAGVLLMTGIYFYSWPTPEWNHNVAQMPLWALFTYALWKACKSGSLVWWLLIGLFAGLSMWAKYSSGLILLVGFLWLLLDTQSRRHLLTFGPWLALISFCVVVWPQWNYLQTNDFLPLKYASERAAQSNTGSGLDFVGAQLGYQLMMFIMAAVAGIFGSGATRSPPGWPLRFKWYLTLMTLGPVVIAVAGAFAKDAGLRDMWGVPMFNFSGLLLLAWLPGRLVRDGMIRLKRFAYTLLIVVPLGYGIDLGFRSEFTDKPKRGNWPQQEISAFFREQFQQATGRELAYVVGPTWHAGLIAIDPPSGIEVMVDGDSLKSPHVDMSSLQRSGYLVVWRAGAPMHESLQAFLETRGLSAEAALRKTFQWADSPTAHGISIQYLVIGPGAEPLPGERSAVSPTLGAG